MAYDNHLYVFFFQMRFISLPNPTKNTILSIIKIRKFCCFFRFTTFIKGSVRNLAMPYKA